MPLLALAVGVASGVLTSVLFEQRYERVWDVAELDAGVIARVNGGREIAWFESAAYGSHFELVSADNYSIEMPVVSGGDRTRGGRVFTQFSVTDLPAGRYELRATPSPHAHEGALIGYGDTAQAETARSIGARLLPPAVGLLVLVVLLGVNRLLLRW